MQNKAVKRLIKDYRDSKKENTLNRTVRILNKMLESVDTKFEASFIDASKHSDEGLSQLGVDGLVNLSTEKSVNTLIELISSSETSKSVRAALGLLKIEKREYVVPILEIALNSKDLLLKYIFLRLAVTLLIRTNGLDTEKKLIEKLKNEGLFFEEFYQIEDCYENMIDELKSILALSDEVLNFIQDKQSELVSIENIHIRELQVQVGFMQEILNKNQEKIHEIDKKQSKFTGILIAISIFVPIIVSFILWAIQLWWV